MDERQKIDLQKHMLPRFNTWYKIRLVIYVVLVLGIFGYLIYAINHKPQEQQKEVTEIEGIEIE